MSNNDNIIQFEIPSDEEEGNEATKAYLAIVDEIGKKISDAVNNKPLTAVIEALIGELAGAIAVAAMAEDNLSNVAFEITEAISNLLQETHAAMAVLEMPPSAPTPKKENDDG